MLDPETCLIALYVLVDTFCKHHVPERPPTPGRQPSLSVSEVVTLAMSDEPILDVASEAAGSLPF